MLLLAVILYASVLLFVYVPIYFVGENTFKIVVGVLLGAGAIWSIYDKVKNSG
jgi:hypothetical protein